MDITNADCVRNNQTVGCPTIGRSKTKLYSGIIKGHVAHHNKGRMFRESTTGAGGDGPNPNQCGREMHGALNCGVGIGGGCVCGGGPWGFPKHRMSPSGHIASASSILATRFGFQNIRSEEWDVYTQSKQTNSPPSFLGNYAESRRKTKENSRSEESDDVCIRDAKRSVYYPHRIIWSAPKTIPSQRKLPSGPLMIERNFSAMGISAPYFLYSQPSEGGRKCAYSHFYVGRTGGCNGGAVHLFGPVGMDFHEMDFFDLVAYKHHVRADQPSEDGRGAASTCWANYVAEIHIPTLRTRNQFIDESQSPGYAGPRMGKCHLCDSLIEILVPNQMFTDGGRGRDGTKPNLDGSCYPFSHLGEIRSGVRRIWRDLRNIPIEWIATDHLIM